MPTSNNQSKRMGILSDTHGLLRPAVIDVFTGVDMILHVGDVGDAAILRELSQIAPVHAVRGNMDRGELFEQLPETLLVEGCGIVVYLLHDLLQLEINPVASGVQMVVHGHTHRASIEQRQRVWYVNPGAAGPARDHGQPSIGMVEVRSREILPRIVAISKFD